MSTEDRGAHAAGHVTPAPTTTTHRDPVVVDHDRDHHRDHGDGAVALKTRRHDLVRWSAIWAGLLVTLATFILLELIFFALGWLTLNEGGQGTTTGLVTAILGLVAFFIGGLVTGRTTIWRDAKEGVLHGIVLWALGIVSIVFLTLFGGGALLGSVASALTDVASLSQIPEVDAGEAVSAAREGAGWAALGAALFLAAAAIGGAVGGGMGHVKDQEVGGVRR